MERCRKGNTNYFPQECSAQMSFMKGKTTEFQFSFSEGKNAGGKCPSFILKGAQKPWDRISTVGEAPMCPKNAQWVPTLGPSSLLDHSLTPTTWLQMPQVSTNNSAKVPSIRLSRPVANSLSSCSLTFASSLKLFSLRDGWWHWILLVQPLPFRPCPPLFLYWLFSLSFPWIKGIL